IDDKPLIGDGIGSVSKVPPWSLSAAQLRIEHAHHEVVAALQLAAFSKDLERKRPGTLDEIASLAGIRAIAARVARGKFDDVAAGGGLPGGHRIGKPGFRLHDLDGEGSIRLIDGNN